MKIGKRSLGSTSPWKPKVSCTRVGKMVRGWRSFQTSLTWVPESIWCRLQSDWENMKIQGLVGLWSLKCFKRIPMHWWCYDVDVVSKWGMILLSHTVNQKACESALPSTILIGSAKSRTSKIALDPAVQNGSLSAGSTNSLCDCPMSSVDSASWQKPVSISQ